MFEPAPQESYPRRLAGALAALPRRYTALLLFAVVMLLPYPTTVAPEWRVRVLDEVGAPRAGAPVRETWQHYSLESDWHAEVLATDVDGYVAFPERRIWASPLRRIVFTSVAAVLTLMHGSMGPSAWVMAEHYSTGANTCSYPEGPGLPPSCEIRIKGYVPQP